MSATKTDSRPGASPDGLPPLREVIRNHELDAKKSLGQNFILDLNLTRRIARAAGIPLQAGVTNGGNDGSEFARLGAVNVSLAWPLRYSHSPAEVLDLRDMRSLSRIVAALAKTPTR